MVARFTDLASRQRGKRVGAALRAIVPGGFERWQELWQVRRRWLACKFVGLSELVFLSQL